MEPTVGFEPTDISKIPPQNSKNFPDGALIGASFEGSSSKLSPDDADLDLKEICNLWPELSPEAKRLLLIIARDGGKAK